MKHLKLLSFIIALSLISCHKDVAEPAEDGPVIAMLEVKSNVQIPKDVTLIRLTELFHDSTTVLIPVANKPDTTKAVLALYLNQLISEISSLRAFQSVIMTNGLLIPS